MRGSLKIKNLLPALAATALCASTPLSALAQCAMCKANVQGAASANPAAVADTLNLAVLVLLIPPVLIFSALFLTLLRYRRASGERDVNAVESV
jgi:hypothetical protein